jgi:hypothetical protein
VIGDQGGGGGNGRFQVVFRMVIGVIWAGIAAWRFEAGIEAFGRNGFGGRLLKSLRFPPVFAH